MYINVAFLLITSINVNYLSLILRSEQLRMQFTNQETEVKK